MFSSKTRRGHAGPTMLRSCQFAKRILHFAKHRGAKQVALPPADATSANGSAGASITTCSPNGSAAHHREGFGSGQNVNFHEGIARRPVKP